MLFLEVGVRLRDIENGRGDIMDWTGILQEIRLLAIQLQTDRFYAIYLLVALLVVSYVVTPLRQDSCPFCLI